MVHVNSMVRVIDLTPGSDNPVFRLRVWWSRSLRWEV
jgi:hypothetical protein